MTAVAERLTRDDLLRLARSDRPWAFLGPGARALDLAPEDAALRFLVAANLGRVGLRSLAIEQLDRLGSDAAGHPDVIALRRALNGLPDDRIDPARRAAAARANLARLGARLFGEAPLPAWENVSAGVEVFAACDGNIVRRPVGAPLSGAIGLMDARGQAGATDLAPLRASPVPTLLEGFDPPWLFLELCRATAPNALGYAPTIDVVQASPFDLLDGLSLADMPELEQPRVRVWAGPDAGDRLGRAIDLAPDAAPPRACFVTAGIRSRVAPPIDAALRAAHARHESSIAEASARAVRAYAELARDGWRRRFDAGASGRAPMRLLVCSSLHSTYVQHAARDLADAARRAGHAAELVIEPDRWTRLSSLAYWRRFDAFRPDLVVLINYTRRDLRSAMPDGVPFVCWTQDPMPHLLDPAAGAAQGPLDFIAGHTFPELYDRFGFPPERALSFPLVASASKFHDGPIEPALRDRVACDIALITNHGETPAQLHDRLCREASGEPAVVALFGRLRPEIESIVARGLSTPVRACVEQACESAMRAAFPHAPPETLARIVRMYAFPLADRLLRHRAARWAADVCARRGWSFKIFGKGWEHAGDLARFHAGSLAHGEELRAAYASARLQLHISLGTMLHQRCIEIALSGGFPAAMLIGDACELTHTDARDALARHGVAREPDGSALLRTADHPELLRLTDQRRRLALAPRDDGDRFRIPAWQTDYLARNSFQVRDASDPWFFGEFDRACFWDQASLEALAERATDSEWRNAAIARFRDRARTLTHDAFLARLLAFIRDRV